MEPTGADFNETYGLIIQFLWAAPLLLVFSLGLVFSVMLMNRQPAIGAGALSAAILGLTGNFLLMIIWAYGWSDDDTVLYLDEYNSLYFNDLVWIMLNVVSLSLLVYFLGRGALATTKAVSMHASWPPSPVNHPHSASGNPAVDGSSARDPYTP